MSKRWVINSKFLSYVQNFLNQNSVKLCLIYHLVALGIYLLLEFICYWNLFGNNSYFSNGHSNCSYRARSLGKNSLLKCFLFIRHWAVCCICCAIWSIPLMMEPN